MKLSSIMIGSPDAKGLSAFYAKLFGKPAWDEDEWFGFMFDGANLMIGPHSEVKGKNMTPGRMMINFDAADVQQEFNRIKSLGAEVIAEPYQPSKEHMPKHWIATFADPDGNYLQVATPWGK